jgi:hypothetical protein
MRRRTIAETEDHQARDGRGEHRVQWPGKQPSGDARRDCGDDPDRYRKPTANGTIAQAIVSEIASARPPWAACSCSETKAVIASCKAMEASANARLRAAVNSALPDVRVSECPRLRPRRRSISGSTKNARTKPTRSADSSSVRVTWCQASQRPCQMNSGAAAQIATQNAAINADAATSIGGAAARNIALTVLRLPAAPCAPATRLRWSP